LLLVTEVGEPNEPAEMRIDDPERRFEYSCIGRPFRKHDDRTCVPLSPAESGECRLARIFIDREPPTVDQIRHVEGYDITRSTLNYGAKAQSYVGVFPQIK